jgi:Family of unknown function (DUF5906)
MNVNERPGEVDRPNPEHVKLLTKAVARWYVRRDSKYYDVDNLTTKLSKDDVQRSCLHRFADEFPDMEPNRLTIAETFRRAFDQKHTVDGQTIPVWNGGLVCKPSLDSRFVWERGTVRVNTWKVPAYRGVPAQPALRVAGEYFDVVFTREAEKAMFLDWLAWCLQNEGDKPAWAPFLYSATKGSGKSTLCELVARLFGEGNSLTQNSVDKLTSRFNLPILTRKLVISEEISLRQDSPQGNALKTYITETVTTSERKGQDAERIEQCCCFLFTSNHLPLWIEPEDRRYYLIELDHDGHATGPNARGFADLVGHLKAFMANDESMAGLYLELMRRVPRAGFSAKTLNVQEDATPLMKRVLGASEQTNLNLLREHLAENGLHSIPEKTAAEIVRDLLRCNPSATRHLMSEIGWTSTKVKWGGCDYTRAVWTEKGFVVFNGNVTGPYGYQEALVKHFDRNPGAQIIE